MSVCVSHDVLRFNMAELVAVMAGSLWAQQGGQKGWGGPAGGKT